MGKVFLSASCAGTPGTDLASLNPQIGNTSSWVNISGQAVVDSTGLAIRSNNTSGCFYTNTTPPVSANQNISYVINPLSFNPSNYCYFSLYLRCTTANGGTGYGISGVIGAASASSSVYIYRTINGSGGVVGGQQAVSVVLGTPITLSGSVTTVGSTAVINLYVNGVLTSTYTDNSPITQVGTIGISLGNDGLETNTTGTHISNVVVWDAGTTLAPDHSGVLLSPGNQYVNPGTMLQWVSQGTYAKFDFTGTSLAAMQDPSIWPGHISTAQCPYYDWSIDGGPWQRGQTNNVLPFGFLFASNLSAGTHTFEVRYGEAGGTDYWTPYSALRITGWNIDTGSTISAPTGNAAAKPKTMMVFGDSITVGYAAGWWPGDLTGLSNYSNAKTAHSSFATLLGAGLNAEVGQVGYSGQGYSSTVNFAENLQTTLPNYDATHTRTWPSGLNYLVIAEGINDSGVVSAATLETAIVAVVTQARSNVGTGTIIAVVAPFTAGATTSDSVLMSTVFSTAVATYKAANPSDAKVVEIDLSGLNLGLGLSNGNYPAGQYVYDGPHPTGEGHAIIAGNIVNAIKAFEATLSLSGTVTTPSGVFASDPVVTTPQGAFA